MAKPKPQYSEQYTVVVKSLSAETTKKAIFLTFKEFGFIKSCEIALDGKTGLPRCAFVNYRDLNDAQTAQKAMDNKKFCGVNVQTSLKINKLSIPPSNKINFQPLTDCSFFEQGECNPKNGKVCPYRHNLRKDQPECSLWQSGECQNVKCIYRHPKKVSAPPTEAPIPTARSSINPYSTRPRTSVHKPSIRLNEGMDIAVEHGGKDLNGIVRWKGVIHSISKEDTFVGVELAAPVSTGTDGTFHSQRFFSCQPGHAIFVKDSLCKAPLLLPIKVPARDGISVKEINVCGHYLQNICRAGDKCDLMHPPVPSSFIWCFEEPGVLEYTCCSVNLNSEIEKAFCDPNRSKYEKAGSLEVNFTLLDHCIYKNVPVSFKRFSTKSISVFPDEPMATTWKWYWLDDDQLWQEYRNEGSTRNDLIEKAYHDWLHNGSTHIFNFNTLQFHYQLDFNKMHQVNLDPEFGTKRAVRRRPVFDARTPRLSPDSSSPSTGSYPKHWPSTFPSCGYLLLEVNTKTRSRIEQKFNETMGARMRYQVVSIKEICNRAFYDKYECQKRLMKKQSSKLNEIQLWHGTAHAIVEHILCQNFDWRLCKKGAYGEGSYFAKEASYSNSYVDVNNKNESFMFLVDVLVGDYCQGSSSYKRPPEKENHRLYDSCVNNMINPTIYVIFERDQFYPRYLVTYKREL